MVADLLISRKKQEALSLLPHSWSETTRKLCSAFNKVSPNPSRQPVWQHRHV